MSFLRSARPLVHSSVSNDASDHQDRQPIIFSQNQLAGKVLSHLSFSAKIHRETKSIFRPYDTVEPLTHVERMNLKLYFLVACYAYLHPALSIGRSESVSLSFTFYFFYESCNMTSLPLPKWPCGLKYGPCPPAHDWSSDVSGLVCFRNELG